jgi:Subtilase family
MSRYDFASAEFGLFEPAGKPDPAFPKIGFRNDANELLIPILGLKLRHSALRSAIGFPFRLKDSLDDQAINIRQWLGLNANSMTGARTKVAIIDTGFSLPQTASDLLFAGNDILDSADRPHGRYVEDIVRQIAPLATLYRAKVRDDSGRYNRWGVLCAILWAVENGVDACSISLEVTQPGDFEKALTIVCHYASKRGCVIFAGVGNWLDQPPSFLSQLPDVVSVNGLNKGNPTYCAHNAKVNCAAPVPVQTAFSPFRLSSAATVVVASSYLLLLQKKQHNPLLAMFALLSQPSSDPYISHFLPKGVY